MVCSSIWRFNSICACFRPDLFRRNQRRPCAGVMLCVMNRAVRTNGAGTTSGPVDFQLHAYTSQCPSEIYANGTFVECSTPSSQLGTASAHATACTEGVCRCTSDYSAPYGITLPGDAGFDTCAALVVDLTTHGPAEPAVQTFHSSYEQRV